MRIKRSLESRIRGWIPKNPLPNPTYQYSLKVSINNKVRTVQPCTFSFMLAGVFMVIAAILSAYFVFINLSLYRGSLISSAFVSTDYRSLSLGLLDLVAFGLSLYAAMLILLRKKARKAKVLTTIVTAFGVATPLIYVLYPISSEPILLLAIANSIRWINGLFLGLPIIAFSIPALILLRSNQRLPQDSNMQCIPVPFAISGALMIVASIFSAYVGLQALLTYGINALNGSTSSFTYQSLALGLLGLGAFGVALAVGRLLFSRQHVGSAVVLVGLVLFFAPAIVFLSFLLYDIAWVAIALTTTASSISALLILGLNHGKLNTKC
jgi:hypothetical protein